MQHPGTGSASPPNDPHKFVQFDPLNTRYLRLENKRGLCRFLEDALCNVGKHTAGATRLTVICTQEDQQQVIRVIDNGSETSAEIASGLGTQLAQNLAKQLGGTFRRYPNQPRGTACELAWSADRKRFW